MNTSRLEIRKALSKQIINFIEKYGLYNEDKKEYNSPDAYAMIRTAKQLIDESVYDSEIIYPHSDFFHGGYKKVSEAEVIHNELLTQIQILIEQKLPCSTCGENVKQYKFCTQCGNLLFN